MAAVGQLLNIESSNYAAVTGRLLRVQSSNIAGVITGRLLDVTSSNVASLAGRLLSVASSNTGAAIGVLTGPTVANPGDTVLLDASASVGTITGITQTGGTPTVSLTGSGASRLFIAPATMGTTAADLTFTVAVTGGPSDTHVISLRRHTIWQVGPDPDRNWLAFLIRARPPEELVPVGDLAGWGPQLAAIDFTTPVDPGGFVPSTTGELTNLQGGTRAWQAYHDYLNVTAAGQQTLAVTTDGYLDVWCKLDASNAPLLTTVRPAIATQTYGRYQVRYRALSVLNGWSVAFGLTPADEIVPNHGKVDYPAGDIHGNVMARYTQASPTGSVVQTDSTEPWSDWHIGVIEWSLNSLKIFHDGVQIYSSTTNVPNTPMYFSIKTAGNSTTDAHVQLDYVAAWSALGTVVPPAGSGFGTGGFGTSPFGL